MDVIIDQLQRIAVSCDDEALHILGCGQARDRTQNVVCLIPFHFHDMKAQRLGTLLCQWELSKQLLGRRASTGLVLIVHFMSEGGSL